MKSCAVKNDPGHVRPAKRVLRHCSAKPACVKACAGRGSRHNDIARCIRRGQTRLGGFTRRAVSATQGRKKLLVLSYRTRSVENLIPQSDYTKVLPTPFRIYRPNLGLAFSPCQCMTKDLPMRLICDKFPLKDAGHVRLRYPASS